MKTPDNYDVGVTLTIRGFGSYQDPVSHPGGAHFLEVKQINKAITVIFIYIKKIFIFKYLKALGFHGVIKFPRK